jgi:hypothetical protein
VVEAARAGVVILVAASRARSWHAGLIAVRSAFVNERASVLEKRRATPTPRRFTLPAHTG